MTTLKLGVLGSFRAFLDADPLADFRTRKVQALLVYLATEPGGHSRDHLMNLLWPGMPERSARSNLRQVLYYLRQILPDEGGNGVNGPAAIVANRQEMHLNPEADVTVDCRQFEALLDSVHTHEHLDLFLCPDCTQGLEAAMALYVGDFLADFYLEDSNEFEEWAQSRRAYYRRKALDALAILATMALRRRDYASAERFAHRQLEIDNLRESGYRQVMQALALSGRREQALAAYETCRRVLAEELGMAPAARTTETYEKILAGDLQFDRLPAQGVRGYELKEPLDEGAYGTLYRAVQPAIMREVAVKVIRRQYADNPEFIRRFEAEAQTVARLEHPHIVPLYDYWRDPDGAYLVMRYMRGGSLLSALKAGPWSAERAAALLEQLAGSLAYAHYHGVVHRDIKPGNILLDGAGNAYLADFGIAKALRPGEPLAAEATITGTLDYVSPEQILGEPVTPQSDIYSLGAVLYETLTGEKPFGDATVPKLLYSQLHEPIPLVAASRPDIPAEVDAVLQKATTKKPGARYATALEMAAAFRGAVGGAGSADVARWREEFVVPLEVTNPYKGLQAFQESDAAHFFGREALVQQLVARLGPTANGQDNRFLAVVGPSGSGKSSVVKAGLIPALRDGALPGSEKWFVTEMVPGSDPYQELELALWRVAVDPPPDLITPLQRDTRGILRTLRRILPAEPEPQDGRPQLLLVIDQFEELFTLVEDETRRALFLDSLLAALAAPHSPLRLVITLRADFYDRPLQRQEWGRLLKENTEVVLPLNSTELTWAVREPARTMGVRLEEGLESTIVAAVVERPGALPLLQYALTELFERREGQLITRAAYEKLGGVQGALGRRAETLFAGLDEAGQETARQLFLRLVTLGEGSEDTRRRVLRAELEALAGAATPEQSAQASVADVLGRFGAARFLTFDRDPLTRAPTVEVAHEALIREWPRLRSWLAESRDDLRLQRLLAGAAGEWQAAGRDPGYLLRHARLDQFAGWAASTSVALTADERAFVEASVAARERRQAAETERQQRELQAARDLAEAQQKRAEEQASAAQRLRRRALYLAGALVVAAVLAFLALGASQRASANAVAAQASAGQAATSEAQAVANAELAADRQEEAESERQAAVAAQATAEAEALVRATAQAEAVVEREAAEEQRTLAEEQARLAFSRELVASSILNLEDDPELSILLALHAVTQADTFQAQGALHEALQSSHLLQRATSDFGRVALSPDGSRLAIEIGWPPEPFETIVRDAATLEVLYSVPGTLADDRWVDGDRLPTINVGDEPGTSIFTLWDAAGRPVSTTVLPLTWPDGAHTPQSLDATSDLSLIAVSAPDGTVAVFDLQTGERVQTLGESGEVPRNWLAFSPDGTLLGANNADTSSNPRLGLILWEVASGREILRRPAGENDFASAIAFSSDGRQVAYGKRGGNVIIVDIASGQDVLELFGHTGNLVFAQFNSAGDRLVTIARDRSARVWDTLTGQMLLRLGLDSSNFVFAALSPDDARLVTSLDSGSIQVWGLDPASNQEWLTVSSGDGCGFSYSPDGRLLAVPGCDDSVRVLDAISGRPVITLTSPISPTRFIAFPAFSPDGARLAAVKPEDNTVVVWDVATGRETLTLSGHTNMVWRLAFSPDGSRLATIAYDKTARLWDATTGAPLHVLNDALIETFETIQIGGGMPIDIAFSPDGSRVATGGGASVKIWDTATGRELLALPPDDVAPYVYTVAFSPDGRHLAVGMRYGAGTGVWDATTGEKLFDLVGHFASVGDIAYSPDGRHIVTSANDATVRLWDAATGVAQMTLSGYRDVVNYVGFSPDGTRLVTQIGDTGELRVYAMQLDDLVAIAQARLTRWFTPEECLQYLHEETCPEKPPGVR